MLRLFIWWFKLKGWTVNCHPTDIKKCVLIAAPHTSNWDFVYSMAGLSLMNMKVNYLAKKELFFWPLKSLLISVGGIPVERKKKSNLVGNVVQLLNKEDELFLMLSPEGTRKRVNKWKSGFYHVALSANIPIMPAFLDYKNKIAGTGQLIYPTGDTVKDMQTIRNFYADKNAKIPEYFDLEAIKID